VIEEVVLGKEDVLFHLRTDDEPYMIISQDGSWTHLLGCVLAYVLQQSYVLDSCMNAYLLELGKNPEKLKMFLPILQEHSKKGGKQS
jgi:hypothetical protein